MDVTELGNLVARDDRLKNPGKAFFGGCRP